MPSPQVIIFRVPESTLPNLHSPGPGSEIPKMGMQRLRLVAFEALLSRDCTVGRTFMRNRDQVTRVDLRIYDEPRSRSVGTLQTYFED